MALPKLCFVPLRIYSLTHSTLYKSRAYLITLHPYYALPSSALGEWLITGS